MVWSKAPILARSIPLVVLGVLFTGACDEATSSGEQRSAEASRSSLNGSGSLGPTAIEIAAHDFRSAPLHAAQPGQGQQPGQQVDRLAAGSSPSAVTAAPIPAAYCQIDVNGVSKATETDYIAHVITCENGGGKIEALKAQAIAARSVAYYAMAENGTICDSQGCQVYTCGAKPQAIHYQAAAETAGQYLSYNNEIKGRVLTYAFYVAGDNDQTDACKAVDPNAGTEKFVTYNSGKSGTDVEETTLGYQFKDPNSYGYGQNRGCMGQWSARCLENDKGFDHVEILRYFYGEDIDILKAEGPCVDGGDSPPEGVIEGADCEGIRGWAYDPDVDAEAIEVVLSFGGEVDDPEAKTAELLAGVSRPDLCDQLGSCEHGFATSGPRSLRDGEPHPVHAYGRNDADEEPVELDQSPMSFACASPELPLGVRRAVDDETIAAWNFDLFWQMAQVSDAVVETYDEWEPLGDAPQLIRAEGDEEVWLVDVGFRRHVPSPEIALAWGLDLDNVALWPEEMVESLPEGTPIRDQVFLLRGDASVVYLLDDPQCPEGGIVGDPLCPADGETQGSASDSDSETETDSDSSSDSYSGGVGTDGSESFGESESSGTSATGGMPSLPPGYGEVDEEGCACAADPHGTQTGGLLLGLLLLLRRRRRVG